jgi:hypothetical protein
MTRPVRVPLLMFVLFLGAAVVTVGELDWQWHKQQREASIYRDALAEARVHCVHPRSDSQVLVCATDRGAVFALGFPEPVHSEGGDQ